MGPIATAVIRLVALAGALLFGWFVGLLVFIDVWPPPSRVAVGRSVAAMTALGSALQLGLFLAPGATHGGPRRAATAALLMAPAALLLGAQLADLVVGLVREGPAVLAHVPASDWRLYGFIGALLATYAWAYVALWRAYHRPRATRSASRPAL